MPRAKIELDPKLQFSLKDASRQLTGVRKRAFIAQATLDYFNGSPRQAETYMGWSRNAVATGLKELETGITCQDNHQAKGRQKTEARMPQLERDLRALVDSQSQADPKFQTTFCYARTSAQAVREALITQKGYTEAQLPSRQTIGTILNRLNYRLKKHKK